MRFELNGALKPLRWAAGLAIVSLAACAQQPGLRVSSAPAGSTYVAMGSSFAAGPGVTASADTPRTRCQRSMDNYAHQLARRRGLNLVDVSCSGATTAHILNRWGELPPQIDAVTPDARLVTVTIGGNDVGYVGGLMAASCAADAASLSGAGAAMCKGMRDDAANNPQAAPVVDEAAWAKLEDAMDEIAREVRRRAPQARLVFVDYLSLLPTTGSCATVPLSDKAAGLAKTTALRLARLTATAARRAGVGLIQASDMSRAHHACAEDNWAVGFSAREGERGVVPYHPNLAGMTAIADALDKSLPN